MTTWRNALRHCTLQTWVLIGLLAVAAILLWTDHRAHVFGALPYLLLLACPLMHLFHHRHKHHQHNIDSGANVSDHGNAPAGEKQGPAKFPQ